MKKRFRLLAIIMVAILLFSLMLAGCKDDDDGGETPDGGSQNLITDNSTLEDVNKLIVEKQNYQLKMTYKEGNVEKKQEYAVSKDKIVDTISYSKNGKNIVEVTATTKEGGKFYEFTKTTVTAAPTPTATNSKVYNMGATDEVGTTTSKVECTEQYYMSKFNQIVNVYIPLMDSTNYEEKDGKFVIKADKEKELASRMGTSIAEVKNISVSIGGGKVTMTGANIEGMSNLNMELTNVGNTVVTLPEDMAATAVEGLTINNLGARTSKGFHLIQKLDKGTPDEFMVEEWVTEQGMATIQTDKGILTYKEYIIMENAKYMQYQYNFTAEENKPIGWMKREVSKTAVKFLLGVNEIFGTMLEGSYYEKKGEVYVVATNKLDPMATRLTDILGEVNGHTMDVDEVKDMIKNLTLKIEGEKVIVDGFVPGQEMIFDEIGKVVISLPNEVKAAEWDSTSKLPDPKPDPDPNPDPEFELTIDNFTETMLTKGGEFLGIGKNAPGYDSAATYRYISDGKNIIVTMTDHTANGEMEGIAAFLFEEGQYWAYSLVKAEGEIIENSKQKITFNEVKSKIKGLEFFNSLLPNHLEIKNGKYVVKQDSIEAFMAVTNMPRDYATSFSFEIKADGTAVMDAVNHNTVYSNIGKVSSVTKPAELNNAMLQEPVEVIFHCDCIRCGGALRKETMNKGDKLSKLHSLDRDYHYFGDENTIVDGFYYDEALTQRIDVQTAVADKDVTNIYVKTKDAEGTFTVTFKCDCSVCNGTKEVYAKAKDDVRSLVRHDKDGFDLRGYYTGDTYQEEVSGLSAGLTIWVKWESYPQTEVTVHCNCENCTNHGTIGEFVTTKQMVRKGEDLQDEMRRMHYTPSGSEIRVFLDSELKQPYVYDGKDPAEHTQIWVTSVVVEYIEVTFYCNCSICTVSTEPERIEKGLLLNQIKRFEDEQHHFDDGYTRIEGYYYDARFTQKIDIKTARADQNIDVYVQTKQISLLKIYCNCTNL